MFGGATSAARSALAEGEPGFRVIVHQECRTSKAPRRFVANLFLKEATRWEDGQAARPVDLKPDNALRRRFSEAVLNRSVSAVKSYWQQRIFSGRGIPPPELESEQAVLEYVATHRGAVGYVSPAADTSKVKVLRVD
jgi:hypothetical protein